jgi:hypothetical protein
MVLFLIFLPFFGLLALGDVMGIKTLPWKPLICETVYKSLAFVVLVSALTAIEETS